MTPPAARCVNLITPRVSTCRCLLLPPESCSWSGLDLGCCPLFERRERICAARSVALGAAPPWIAARDDCLDCASLSSSRWRLRLLPQVSQPLNIFVNSSTSHGASKLRTGSHLALPFRIDFFQLPAISS